MLERWRFSCLQFCYNPCGSDIGPSILISIVDKNTRSMSPIGEKASGYTNVIMGAGSVVLFFQTALEHRNSIDRQWRFYAVIAIHWFHFIPDSFLGVLFLSTCLASYA